MVRSWLLPMTCWDMLSFSIWNLQKIIPGQISRVETKSYPGDSLREAILYAICHAEYFAPSNIKIEFFPDKVKATNPGNIYNEGTIEDIKSGIQSFRNLSLVILLNKLGYIENYGKNPWDLSRQRTSTGFLC